MFEKKNNFIHESNAVCICIYLGECLVGGVGFSVSVQRRDRQDHVKYVLALTWLGLSVSVNYEV